MNTDRIDATASLGAGRIMTMGEFRKITAGISDDTAVTIATDGWYDCLQGIVYDPEGGTPTVTLFAGDSFDCRFDDPNSPWFDVDPNAYLQAVALDRTQNKV